MSWEFRTGDAVERLREVPDESVQCVVTSPPYWGLRDYGTAEWEGGDPTCEHRVGSQVPDSKAKGAIAAGVRPGADTSTCLDCGASRIDGQLGLEPTPEAYVAAMVEVFREVRRALRPDGVVWLNLGDSYNNRVVSRPSSHQAGLGFESEHLSTPWAEHAANGRARMSIADGDLKEKDLVGIPWMVAFALRADGWWLRSDVIWAKPNPMPESVEDRPTRSHEYIFLLTKSAHYFYDGDAIREAAEYGGAKDTATSPYGQGFSRRDPEKATKRRTVRPGIDTNGGGQGAGEMSYPLNSRNRRTVWTVPTRPFADAHFATFPPKLIEPCVRAGSAEGDLVLDPFAGAGTAVLVAHYLGRAGLGIELNPEYVSIAEARLRAHDANPNGHLTGDPEPIDGQIALLDEVAT